MLPLLLFIAVSTVNGDTAFAPLLHDATLDQGNPDTCLGASDVLTMSSYVGPVMRIALLFDLGGVPDGATITGARLWLRNINLYGQGHSYVGRSTHDGWTQDTVTWNSFAPWMPAEGGFTLAYRMLAHDQWISWELDSGVWPVADDLADGRVTLVVRSSEDSYYTDSDYHSSEAQADHPYLEVDYVRTVQADYACSPDSGTVPFQTMMTATLQNLYTGQSRQLAGRIHIDLANGGQILNWRGGYTNVPAGGSYSTTWLQTIPALGVLIGESTFTLVATDITPAPFNQPPYPASGDTDTAVCTVTAFAP
jgi:hypothetical protein